MITPNSELTKLSKGAFHRLIVSCPNEKGGLFVVLDRVPCRVDYQKTTGVVVHQKKLIRALQPQGILIGGKPVAVNVEDVHDVLVSNDRIYVASTGANQVIELSLQGDEIQRYEFDGEGDAWHINCLVEHEGRVLFSAFGQFRSHREYKGRTLGAGFVRDLRSGDIVVSNLSQPHSLMSHNGTLYIADSGCGELVKINSRGSENRVRIGDYLRGIFLRGDTLYVGLSSSRNIEVEQRSLACLRSYDLNSLEFLDELTLDAHEIYTICDFDSQSEVTDFLEFSSRCIENLEKDRVYLIGQLENANARTAVAVNNSLSVERLSIAKERAQHVEEISRISSELSYHIKGNKALNLALEKERAQHAEEISRISLELSSHIKKNKALSSALQDADDCLTAAYTKISAQSSSLTAINRDLEVMNSQLELKTATEQVLRSEHVRLEATNYELTSKLESALRDCALNFVAARTLEEREAALLEKYNAILGSRSWKVTKPLRAGRRMLTAVLARDFKSLWYDTFGRIRSNSKLARLKGYLSRKIIQLSNSSQNLAALNALIKSRDKLSLSSRMMCDDALSRIDLSIVTYNSAKWLDKYFASLVQCGYPLALISIYVVDHGSNDGTLDELYRIRSQFGQMFEKFEVRVNKNRGFGAGHDFNIHLGANELVLISNVDLEFKPNSLQRLVGHAHRDISAAYAGWEMRQVPYEHPKHYDPVSWDVNWQAYACVLIRRSAYMQVGGFDKRIFMYCEDVELSYRFRSFGWRLMYCPDCVVIHHSYENGGELFKPMQFYMGSLGACFVRIRFGTWRDKLMAFVLSGWLIVRVEQPIKGSRKQLTINLFRLIINAPHFLLCKGHCRVPYSFRGFDFELSRVGAAYKVQSHSCSQAQISIITRTYNSPRRADLLMQAGMSVGNQNYKNIQWVVVQDGGSEMEEVISKIREIYPHLTITFICNPKQGRSAAGNRGLSEATGKYCMFLDDDDLLYADHCELLVNKLEADSSLVGAYALAFEVPTDFDGGCMTEGDYIVHATHSQDWSHDVLMKYNYIPIQAMLFHRALFEERGGFNVELDQLEDWNLWLRYGYRNRFLFVPKTTSLYRVPKDKEVRSTRHGLLHAAYDVAKADALEKIRALHILLYRDSY